MLRLILILITASPGVKGASPEEAHIFVGALPCPDWDLLRGSRVSFEPRLLFFPITSPVWVYVNGSPQIKTTTSHQLIFLTVCQGSPVVPAIQPSSQGRRICRSYQGLWIHYPLGADALIYLPGKGSICWNYINIISIFFITMFFLESVKKGSIILKFYEIVVIPEAYATLTFS